ncbi:hypothetical protein EHEL_101520 [Encephalitozoon hellem ATCC 50504]|uniref:uncharacterized protein n=1 Tax=Encephalitozoon hellem (strain ATCC 50504) TaxID=907965 RepID=UPI000269D99D|nr:uncharacterized protein EHEL_101520 [Encephalitozoon hellem ATCC 50504]AFM99244.1 hypothetical protein EHEL_101520 [Encephalitozoon hellem ATCC 50504]|eukprot:XP_003888225.1 hypothetical protein EHEL_101520 [Encephalitozoon hellem ATCC 50504]
MDGSSDKNKDREDMPSEKLEEGGMPTPSEERSAACCESPDPGVMKHVIGAACMLSHKSSSEDIAENNSDEKVSTFDIYIVNEDGKVNGYELKHITPIDESKIADPQRDSSVNEMMRSFRFDRKSKGVPPQEFYRRRKSSELPRSRDGNNSCGSKEKCEPIILEISEISDTYNADGVDEGQDNVASGQDTVLSTGSLQHSKESLGPLVVLNDSSRQESLLPPSSEGSASREPSKEESSVVPLDEVKAVSETSEATSLESKGSTSAGSESEAITLSSSCKAIKPKESEDEEAKCGSIGDIIKAIQAQEPSERFTISRKIGLNSPCEGPEVKCPCEVAENSENLSKELKNALLAAFIPSMEPPVPPMAEEASDTSEMSFVETSITRNVNEKLDSAEEMERFRAILSLGVAASNPACPDEKRKTREGDKDDEMIIFVEAEDVHKKKNNMLTRNNRVGQLVKFFEDLEEKNKEKD